MTCVRYPLRDHSLRSLSWLISQRMDILLHLWMNQNSYPHLHYHQVFPELFQPYPPLPPIPPPPILPINGSLYTDMRRTAETTFQSLILLLKSCPRLRSFHVVINATKLDGLRSDKPGSGVCNRWVKYVNIMGSPVNDPEVVARILLDIIPELESVLGSDAPLFSQEPHGGWIRVQEIIRAAKEATAAGPVT